MTPSVPPEQSGAAISRSRKASGEQVGVDARRVGEAR